MGAQISGLVKRNMKLFFKDKGMFFTSLVTPIILLALYGFFLGDSYEKTFEDILKGVEVSDKLIKACVGSQLLSSLMAVCCVTIAFCSNLLMVQDKVTGARKDLCMSPVHKSTLAFSYFIANVLTTLLICYLALGVCFIYLSKIGWYLSGKDVMLLIVDVLLLTLFGSAFSSMINYFLTSQGQISAVGAIVSAGYGFVCGAFIPISQFSKGIQKFVSFLPGTYGTGLLRNHVFSGIIQELENDKVNEKIVDALKDTLDCNLYFFDKSVSINRMYIVLTASVVVLITAYILINKINGKKI